MPSAVSVVGDDQSGVNDQGPGNRDTLFLPAGYIPRQAPRPVSGPDVFWGGQGLGRRFFPGLPLRGRRPGGCHFCRRLCLLSA